MVFESSKWRKNPTPQQIAVLVSLIVALFVSALSGMLWALEWLIISYYWVFLVIFAAVFFFTYWVSILYLKHYIYRKIKLIYKTIHRYKLKEDDAIHPREDIWIKVQEDVSTWATEKNQEVSDLKKLEEYRRNYLGNISHELKTPIFNIQGYVHTLLDGALKDDKVNLLYLQRASKNIDHLQTIIDDLETINRLESGQLLLEMRAFDIRTLTEEVIEDMEIRAKEKNIKITLKEGANKRFKVKADRDAIRQVLSNLITNSIKYGKRDGSTKIGFYDMDSYLLVEVADTGYGIPQKHLNHVFDRFYRVDKSRSREEGGSGLGLSIVKHIIEAHHQTIHVRSTEGVGSTFGFTLQKAG